MSSFYLPVCYVGLSLNIDCGCCQVRFLLAPTKWWYFSPSLFYCYSDWWIKRIVLASSNSCYSSIGSEPGVKRHFSKKPVVLMNERGSKVLVWNDMVGIYWSLHSASVLWFSFLEGICQNWPILKIGKTLDGLCALIFREFRFSMRASYFATQNAVYWMVRACNHEKVQKRISLLYSIPYCFFRLVLTPLYAVGRFEAHGPAHWGCGVKAGGHQPEHGRHSCRKFLIATYYSTRTCARTEIWMCCIVLHTSFCN